MEIYYYIGGVATGVLLAVFAVCTAILVCAWRSDRAIRRAMDEGEGDEE